MRCVISFFIYRISTLSLHAVFTRQKYSINITSDANIKLDSHTKLDCHTKQQRPHTLAALLVIFARLTNGSSRFTG
ncbi:hypothetical protein, partial [Pectobacterium brasiliense]|uniref:hypothetical protein n=1 Tax=Pectobacterium brasiliense TaxID=180957 RepID=UPI001968CBD2